MGEDSFISVVSYKSLTSMRITFLVRSSCQRKSSALMIITSSVKAESL